RRALACKLERIAVGGDDDGAASPFFLLPDSGCKKVVGFEARPLRGCEAEGAHEVGQEVELLEQLGIELASSLIAGEELVSIRRNLQRVPADEDRSRLLPL